MCILALTNYQLVRFVCSYTRALSACKPTSISGRISLNTYVEMDNSLCIIPQRDGCALSGGRVRQNPGIQVGEATADLCPLATIPPLAIAPADAAHPPGSKTDRFVAGSVQRFRMIGCGGGGLRSRQRDIDGLGRSMS